MKNLRMILSAVIVFAAVGSALAFKTKTFPNLYECNLQNQCVISIYSDIDGEEVDNPPALYKPGANFNCGAQGDCKRIPVETPVYINE